MHSESTLVTLPRLLHIHGYHVDRAPLHRLLYRSPQRQLLELSQFIHRSAVHGCERVHMIHLTWPFPFPFSATPAYLHRSRGFDRADSRFQLT